MSCLWDMSPFFADKTRQVDPYSQRNISCLVLVPKTCWEDMFVSQQCKPYQRLHQVYNYLLCVLSLTINVNGGYWRLPAMVRVRRWWDLSSVRCFLGEGWAWAWAQDRESNTRLLRDMSLSSRNEEKYLALETFRDMSRDKGHLDHSLLEERTR